MYKRQDYKGIGVAEDNDQAAYWFDKSAQQGHGRALYLLGQCYEAGFGVVQDPAKAVELYIQADEKGHP